MFYDIQPKEHQDNYKNMLQIVGQLSRLFSSAEEPYLYYRAHENIFAKYFDVVNNARSDDSADACSKSGFGIGLKTWVGQDNQKVAEFGRLRPHYENLRGIELVKRIAGYRNKRISTTMNSHGLHGMLYHIVKRYPGCMRIYEASFDPIDVDRIVLDENRGGANSIYFSDGKHTYHFSLSKNTLYMIFDDMVLLDTIQVDIADDPYDLITNVFNKARNEIKLSLVKKRVDSYKLQDNQLCLRLYSVKSGVKQVAEKSGLNQWNGSRLNTKTGVRTPRDPNEVYIPYPAEDRRRKDFFPPRDTPFDLRLPDGEWISAKVCQQDSKAIMSNPNLKLGKWLLRDVFELPEGKLVTYNLLKECNIDCVLFTKLEEGKYSVDFCKLGSYEKFYGIEDVDAQYDISESSE